jgi:two-component system, NarL family, nitrate/nitrite response regulator NarL
MNISVLSPVRIIGDGLSLYFRSRPEFNAVAVVSDFSALRQALAATEIDIVLIDVTQGVDLWNVRAIAAAWPDVPLVALGLPEQRQEVLENACAIFAGYVPRDASIEALCEAVCELGRFANPAGRRRRTRSRVFA